MTILLIRAGCNSTYTNILGKLFEDIIACQQICKDVGQRLSFKHELSKSYPAFQWLMGHVRYCGALASELYNSWCAPKLTRVLLACTEDTVRNGRGLLDHFRQGIAVEALGNLVRVIKATIPQSLRHFAHVVSRLFLGFENSRAKKKMPAIRR